MKRFISAVVFCLSLLCVLSFVLVRSSRAKEDVIQVLLDLPAPPPPNPLIQARGERNPEFYSKKNPPKDDAPIEDILDYWRHQSQNYRELGFNIFPSESSLDRILGEVRKDPDSAAQFLRVFKDSPRAVELIKNIYENSPAESGEGDQRPGLKEWLKYNSAHFAGDLSRAADKIVDADEYLTNQDDLLALGRHAWDRAKNHVNRLYADSSNPTSQVLAKWVLYRRALDDDSIGDIDRYRDELRAVVENRSATHGQRDLALDALLKEKEWSGRDDWYFSLFEDETLADLRIQGRSYTGLTTLIYYSPPGKYADKMIELSKSTNPAVRAAAVRNLALMIDAERPDVIRALLPWLENPKWARDIDNARSKVVQALQTIKMPESVTGLLVVLDEKETRSVPNYNGNSAVNVTTNSNSYANYAGAITVSNTTRGGRTETVYPLRNSAIDALGTQGDMRAAPALRRVFSQVETYQRSSVVSAILKVGGFTVSEQLEALEAQAVQFRDFASIYTAARKQAEEAVANSPAIPDPDVDPENVDDAAELERRILAAAANTLGPRIYSTRGEGSDIKTLLGVHMASLRNVSDELARAVIKRIEQLDRSDAELARVMRNLVVNWNSQFINAFMLSDLKTGKAGSGVIVKLLSIRKELREKQMPDVADVKNGGATASGFAACLTESDSDYAAILAGQNVDSKKALLACGRLIRARFSVPEVAKLLQGSDKQLVLAAERYLESEDSPEARRIVLSLYPNQAKILGATIAFRGGAKSLDAVFVLSELFASVNGQSPDTPGHEYANRYTSRQFDKTERRLQKEVLANAELLGVYSYAANFVRIYKDRAVFSWEEDDSRYRERTLEPSEFDNLKGYLAHHNVDSLVPFLACAGGCEAKELVMVSKAGGRRVFFNTTKKNEFESGLEAIFEEFKRPPAKLHYWLEKEVPGLEILFADNNFVAHAFWKNGADMRLLVSDAVREKEIEREIAAAVGEDESEEEEDGEGKAWQLRQKRKYDHFLWRSFAGGVLGDTVAQPVEVEYIPVKDAIIPAANDQQWKARAGNLEVRDGNDDEGLFKIVAGRAVKIGTGTYSSPVVSANGAWTVAYKSTDEESSGLVRINLATGREFRVASQEARYASPIAYVTSINRFLVGNVAGDNEHGEEPSATSDGSGSFFWLDAASGAIQPATGEMRPLGQQRFRPLQPAAGEFEYWAAIPNARENETVFGTYGTRTFKMTPLLRLPKIQFNSQVMWVDAGKLYFIYDGHLLAVPFKR